MTAPICPVDGRACPAACAGKPSCERAGAVVGRVRSAAARKQAEDAVIEAAKELVTFMEMDEDDVNDVAAGYLSLKAAVDALNALEGATDA